MRCRILKRDVEFSMDRSRVRVLNHQDADNHFSEWQKRDPSERLAAVELARQMVHGNENPISERRIQRVLTVTRRRGR